MSKIYKNDIGTIISLDFQEDISASTSTTRRIYYKRPGSATESFWSASLDTDNQTLIYTTTSGDINTAGTWSLQGYIETASWQGRSETVKMNVWSHHK